MRTLFALLLLTSPMAAAESYRIQPASTKLGFTALYVKWMKVPGHFKDFQGVAVFDTKAERLEGLTVTVKVASIDTGIPPRDSHLRERDFFFAERFPEATFSAGPIQTPLGQGVALPASLNLRGKTLPLALTVTYLGLSPTAQGPVAPAFKLEGSLKRKDFGVSYGPNLLLDDAVEMRISGVLEP